MGKIQTGFFPFTVSGVNYENQYIRRARHFFNDKRLEKLNRIILERVIEKQSIVIQQMAKNDAQARQFYRFLNNKRVHVEELIMENCKIKQSNQKDRRLLVLGDTTGFNLGKHLRKIKDIETVGVLIGGKSPGFHAHVQMVVDAATQNVLGLADIIYWARSKKDEEQFFIKSNMIAKESQRWMLGAANAKNALRMASKITYIYDSEADNYDLFHYISKELKRDFVIRAHHDRMVKNSGIKSLRLNRYLEQCEVMDIYEVELRELDHYTWTEGKRIKRKKRTAKLEIRFGKVEVMPPKKSNIKQPLALTVLQIKEVTENLPEGETPLNWILWTTLTIKNKEQAREIVDYYLSRWYIEQLFRTLKRKGFSVEATELETFDAILRQTTIALAAAVRVLQLVYARDKMNAQPIEEVFSQEEEIVLEKINEQVQGLTEKQKNIFPRDRLSWATWIIARLGGWKGYRSQRPPGPRTIMMGLRIFKNYVNAYKLFNSS